MSRKIKARTLATLISRYLADFPAEAAAQVADSGGDDGAELLGLLDAESAWKLSRRLPAATARAWLGGCGEETLRRMVEHVDPSSKATQDEDRDELEQRAVAILAAGSR